MGALAGTVAVVTGASRGIGAAAAAALWGAGARVVRVARHLAEGPHDGFLDVACDLTDVVSWERAAGRILAEAGVPDLVVHNAGAFLLKPFAETTREDFDRQVALNLGAAFSVARSFLPPMRARGAGRFITLGSVADHVAFPENAAYSASKYGVRGLHEVLAAEYRGTGVRLTLLSPGPTDTSVWDPVNPDAVPHLPNRAQMLRPADVADAILWLATRPPHVHVDWLRIGPA